MVLCDYDELPENYQIEYNGEKHYDFIAVENKNIYPLCEYQLVLE
jgi:hypothetical protein